MRRSIPAFVAVALAALLLAPASALAQTCDPSFGGKYQELIRQIAVPEDAQQYGACHDYGPWNGTSYKGHDGLPTGAFWTYAAPHWYIWAKRGQARIEMRAPVPGPEPAPTGTAPGGQVPRPN